MSGASELDELRSLITGVRRQAALQSQYGATHRCAASSMTPTGCSTTSTGSTSSIDEVDFGRAAAPQLHCRAEDPHAGHAIRHRLLARRRRRRPRRAVRLKNEGGLGTSSENPQTAYAVPSLQR